MEFDRERVWSSSQFQALPLFYFALQSRDSQYLHCEKALIFVARTSCCYSGTPILLRPGKANDTQHRPLKKAKRTLMKCQIR
jgi:hypothetical protein